MTDHQPQTPDADQPTFTWHPDYCGRTADSVERDLADQLANDQRAYELALAGAEKAEHQALASVMELEKRWSAYSFDWAETPPDDLARRIVEFQLERDRRQEMISYDQYREEAAPASHVASPDGGWRETMSDEQRRRVASLGAGVILIAVAVVIIIVMSIVL